MNKSFVSLTSSIMPPVFHFIAAGITDGVFKCKMLLMPGSLLKPWSISTAVRSPERLRGFLYVLKQLDGAEWNHITQVSFQVRLIQARQYGAGETQFYRGLSPDDVKLIENSDKKISLKRAKEIFAKKNYEDPPMRGRNSFKPLQKFGFALISGGRVHITESGRALLAEESDYGEIFLRSLLKWQLPNPLERSFPERQGYNIKPFVGAVRLIDEVNKLCRKRGMKPRGLSRLEFNFFALTLMDWRRIKATAGEIFDLRKRLEKVPKADKDAFFKREAVRLRRDFELKHLPDYGDNALRYFRMTKYIRLRGWDTHVDLEPMRQNELRSLFKSDDASPLPFVRAEGLPLGGAKINYAQFLADIKQPTLPGENKDELAAAVNFLRSELKRRGEETRVKIAVSAAGLKKQRDNLRMRLQSKLRQRDKQTMILPRQAQSCIRGLRGLLDKNPKGLPPSLSLERLAALGLNLMNDAKKIRPNCPLGDDGEPTNTAPAGKPDIECFYKNFAAICEVTMMRGHRQWVQEAQPVMRHLSSFCKSRSVIGKPAYCLFIAPSLHQDTLNIFRFSVKQGYEGNPQRIAPLALEDFCVILDFFKERIEIGRPVKSGSIKLLFDAVSDSLGEMETSDVWRKRLRQVIEEWKRSA